MERYFRQILYKVYGLRCTRSCELWMIVCVGGFFLVHDQEIALQELRAALLPKSTCKHLPRSKNPSRKTHCRSIFSTTHFCHPSLPLPHELVPTVHMCDLAVKCVLHKYADNTHFVFVNYCLLGVKAHSQSSECGPLSIWLFFFAALKKLRTYE